MKIGDVAGALGRGAVAGLVGTAAMTVSQTVEAKLRHREASTTPADAAAEVLGVEPTEETKSRFAQLVHWAYGTSWGLVRGVLGPLPAPVATAAHLGAVQGTAMVMLPGLDVAPPVKEWGAAEIASEVLHHVVYAVAAGATYEFLDRRSAA
jgi:hypothetical protein